MLYQGILNCTDFVFKWDPVQFEDSRHHQGYVETDGSIAYLQSNIVKQLVSLRKYMILLFSQDRAADQKYTVFYFILGEQWFNLTLDMKTALVNAFLENHGYQTTPGTPMSNFTSPSSPVSMRSPINWSLASFKKVEVVNPNLHSTICSPEPQPPFVLDTPNPQSQPLHPPDICPSPDNPPQDVDISCQLSDHTSTTDSLDESSTYECLR